MKIVYRIMKIFFLFGMFVIVVLILGYIIKTDVNSQIFDNTMEVVVEPPAEFTWAGRSLSDPTLRNQQGELVSTAQKYVDALEKFPDFKSCLKDSRSTSQTLDVLRFDWSSIRSIPEFDVCVFHVANALHDIDRLDEWLEVSGFYATPRVSTKSSTKYVDVTWNSEINMSNSPYPRSILLDWFERVIGVGKFSVTIQLDQTNKVISIQSGFIYE